MTARRVGLAAGAVALVAAAYADMTGHLQARLVLWIAAGVLSAPAVLHALVYGLPTAYAADPRGRGAPFRPVHAEVLPPAPVRPAGAVVGPERPAVAVSARVARRGLPPSPKPRQLTS